MIKRIVIKDTATFDSTGVELDNLQKVNFIYGGNACGKTTISSTELVRTKMRSDITKKEVPLRS